MISQRIPSKRKKSDKKDYNDKVTAMLSLEGKKRKLTHNAADFGSNETPLPNVPTDNGSPTTKLFDTIKEESYWDSSESKYLFRPEENKKVLNTLSWRMLLLKVAITTHDGYQKSSRKSSMQTTTMMTRAN